MPLIQPISSITQDALKAIVPGYSSSCVFQVDHTIDEDQVSFSLKLKKLDHVFVKEHDYSDSTILAHYNEIASQGWSYGAFANHELIGFIIGEVQPWNSTLVIREFGVSPARRKQGVGGALLKTVLERAQKDELRGILCETQTTNVSAIRLYQKYGFTIQGLDLSLYSNHDPERGEVAVFLRRSIG